MVYSYYPGCTLKNKAQDLDRYARMSAEALAFPYGKSRNGSAVELSIRWRPMRSPQSCPQSAL